MGQLVTDIFSGFFQEAVFFVALVAYLLSSLFLGKYFYKASKWVAISVIIAVLCSTLKLQIIPNYYSFNGAFVTNLYVVFIKTMILICTFFVILLSKNMVIKKRNKVFDFFILILFATLGAISLVSANDFLTMFVSLELLGVSSYFLSTFSKPFKSKESSIKYVITGGVASAVMLLGISYIYLATGSLNFDVLYSFLRQNTYSMPFFDLGCVLCILGLTFKLGLVPFSKWLPDTFEGTSNNVAAFISLVPIFAVLGIISKLIVYVFQYTSMAQALLFIIGVVSIFKGLLGMIRQDSLKRFMGYSTIAQSGFIILGFALANTYSTSTSLFYMISYIFMNVGAWAAIIQFSNTTGKISIPDLKGLAYASKSFSLVWIICLLSLAGLPVTAGFFAKIYLFVAIAKCSELYLCLLMLVMFATVTGIYAYFRPIREMFCIGQNDFYKNPKFNSLKLTLYICAIVTIVICLCPDKLIQICQLVAYQL